MLGTSQGSVHKQRQGTGFATILSSDNLAIKDYMAHADDDAKAKVAAAQAKKAATDAAMKDMLGYNPDRWLKHSNDIQGRLNEWVDQGARILASGRNPSNSLDQDAAEWRRKKADIAAYSQASEQMQKMYEATRSKIDGSEADKYDPASIQQMRDYFDIPVEKVVNEGILPPPLLQRKPALDLQKTWAGLTGDLYARNGKQPLDEAGKWDFVRASMANNNDPMGGASLLEGAESYFHNLPAAEQQKYQDRAKNTGRSIQELVNYDFFERYSPGKEPFDLNTFIQKGVDSIDVPYASYKSPTGFGRYVDKKEFDTIATNRAQVMMADPVALYEYQKLLPVKEDEAEGVYRARAVADLAKRLKATKATSTESGVTAEGKGAKDLSDSGNKWLQDIKSSDGSRSNEAAGYLFDTPGIAGNLNVAAAQVQQPDASNPFSRYLVLTLKGNPSLKEVKEQFIDKLGTPKEKVSYQTVGTESSIIVPITDDTENALLRLHDAAFKSAKRPYGGAGVTWNADKILNQPATGEIKSPVQTKSRF